MGAASSEKYASLPQEQSIDNVPHSAVLGLCAKENGRGLESQQWVASRPSFARIILSAGRFSSGPVIEIGRVSEDHSHNALVIGESPLGIATAEEPLRQGARTLGSREGQIYITGHRSDR